MATCIFAAGLLAAARADAVEAITIKMVLNNTQAKAVRDGEGETVAVRLTDAQRALVRVRAPKYQGSTIRVASSQLSPANKISLTILRPDTAAPILRVKKRSGDLGPETPYEDPHGPLAAIRAKVTVLRGKLDGYLVRLEEMEKRLRAFGEQATEKK